jgi:hypothetical protein
VNILFLLFLAYVLAPKIDLITASGSGVRPEDLITVAAFVIYICKRQKAVLRMPKHVRVYGIFVGVGFLSALVNYPQEGLVGIVFATRLVEYMVWFFIMYEACQTVSPQQVRTSLLIVSTILIIWGGLETAGLTGKIGKFTGAEGRLTINTSGPFETSVMLAMLAYAAQQLVVTPAMMIMVIMTQSRITLVAIIASFLAIRPGRGLVIAGIGLFAAAILAGPIMSLLGESRLAKSATPLAMVQLLATEWERVPQVDNPLYFRERFLGGDTVVRYIGNTRGDVSFKFRAVRWPLVVKSTLFSPFHSLIGWAPGAWGAALDSYYVRVFGEVGLIGTAVFLWWLFAFARDARRDSVSRFSIYMLIIVAVFIDIFTSSKVMPILWAFAALDHAQHPAGLASPMFRRARRLLLPSLSGQRSPPLRTAPAFSREAVDQRTFRL